jgi:hypothetical protein
VDPKCDGKGEPRNRAKKERIWKRVEPFETEEETKTTSNIYSRKEYTR